MTACGLRNFFISTVASAALVHGPAVRAQSVEDLRHMSLEELADVTVSSVLKSEARLSETPAALYVISQADIQRSGATTVPEALRLAPNLQVAQTSPSKYVITSRGMSGNDVAQNFPNKLLILIDGRSVYAPLFSGVYWDAQDVLLADVDRIEVLSGPGGTLWGANAVTGVINIITRQAAETQGVLVDVAAGNEERVANLRYGGRAGSDIDYRLYAKIFRGSQFLTTGGAEAQNGWNRAQGGFRIDWAASPDDLITVQGDAYRATINQGILDDQIVKGSNVLARWTSASANGQLQVQAYYDRTSRKDERDGLDFEVDTFDLDVQRNLNLGNHALVFGGGLRVNRYDTMPLGGLAFSPAGRTLKLGNVFAQDMIALDPSLKLTLGLKYENYPFGNDALLPNAILAWQARASVFLWAAASQAVRSATPFDTDVVETVGPTVFIIGNPDFRSEKVTAFELGTRVQPTSDISLSLSTFYNRYDDVRSVEITPVTFLPLIWGNEIRGRTYGLEAWADYKLTPWWKMSATYGLLLGNFRFSDDASGLLGVSQVRNDPKHQASLRSSMNLGPSVTFDANLRHVSKRPSPRVDAYTELNAQLAWRVSDHLQLSLSGANLLHKSHLEYVSPGSNRIPRRVLLGLQWQP